MRNLFSPRDYTNSLEEKVSLKDTRHIMDSPLIYAASTQITCKVHLNRFKSQEEFILYLGQGIISLQQLKLCQGNIPPPRYIDHHIDFH